MLDDTSPVKSRYEAELLLRCARTRPADKACERTETPLETGIDWEHLFQTADAHGVIPLLYKFLNETCRQSVPEHATAQLRDRFIQNTQSNLALTAELLKIFDLLKAHGVPAIAYKGPALAASVYGDIALRQFVDLDILVRRQDVFDVKEILVKQEYNPEFVLTESQKAAFLDNHYDYAFLRNESNALVEIHWEVAEGFLSFPLSVESLLERIRPVDIAGRQVATLSAEDSLLVLCIHGSKHLWTRLGWICDVARLIEREKELNWQQASARAAALGSKRMFLLGLFLAGNLLGAPLPKDLLQQAEADQSVLSLAEGVRKRLFDGRNNAPGMFESSMFHLKMRERLLDKSRYCFRMAMTTNVRDWMFLPMPRALFFLYYPLRPIRLAGKYALKLLKSRF